MKRRSQIQFDRAASPSDYQPDGRGGAWATARQSSSASCASTLPHCLAPVCPGFQHRVDLASVIDTGSEACRRSSARPGSSARASWSQALRVEAVKPNSAAISRCRGRRADPPSKRHDPGRRGPRHPSPMQGRQRRQAEGALAIRRGDSRSAKRRSAFGGRCANDVAIRFRRFTCRWRAELGGQPSRAASLASGDSLSDHRLPARFYPGPSSPASQRTLRETVSPAWPAALPWSPRRCFACRPRWLRPQTYVVDSSLPYTCAGLLLQPLRHVRSRCRSSNQELHRHRHASTRGSEDRRRVEVAIDMKSVGTRLRRLRRAHPGEDFPSDTASTPPPPSGRPR